MKKNLLTLSALTLSLVANAQILTTVQGDTSVKVEKNTLLYNGGGFQVKSGGTVENRGNVMVSGSASDTFVAPENSFYNRINDDASNVTTGYTYDHGVAGVDTFNKKENTYGQLYITGLTQANITGIVNQEYQRESNGAYQQMALPFYDKEIVAGLSSDLGATFEATRYSQKEPLYWDNASVVSMSLGAADKTGAVGHRYYMLGAANSGFNSTVKKEVKGRPYAEENTPDVTLANAGNFSFGTGGTSLNSYNEMYNTYLQDSFHQGTAWEGTFGQNIYQFGNPYLTNLDLSNIHKTEGASIGDGVNLSNIYGIRLEHMGVTYSTSTGSAAANYRYVTYNSGVATGDVSRLVVRPMGTFVIKLKDNTGSNQTVNFKNLRRFKYTGRADGTNYSVNADRNANNSTVKQLGIVGLDENGLEVGRTYYVVYPNATTGFLDANPNSTQIKAQTTNPMGSFEESTNGGYDTNVWGNYWLYINEANENDFLGKNIKVHSYDPRIKSFKFEIRENANLVDEGTHQLAQGIGFYYKGTDGVVKEVKQGDVINLEDYSGTLAYDFYYGTPDKAILAVDEAMPTSRTQVVYNPAVSNYIVMFDPKWKSADIEVYDMSGRLVITEANVNTSSNYVIKLDDKVKAGYMVKVTSNEGDVVSTKILK